jgi:hypothetical protein
VHTIATVHDLSHLLVYRNPQVVTGLVKESSYRNLNLKRLTRKIMKLEETNHSWNWNIFMIIRNEQDLFEPFRYRTDGAHRQMQQVPCTTLDTKKG